MPIQDWGGDQQWKYLLSAVKMMDYFNMVAVQRYRESPNNRDEAIIKATGTITQTGNNTVDIINAFKEMSELFPEHSKKFNGFVQAIIQKDPDEEYWQNLRYYSRSQRDSQNDPEDVEIVEPETIETPQQEDNLGGEYEFFSEEDIPDWKGDVGDDYGERDFDDREDFSMWGTRFKC